MVSRKQKLVERVRLALESRVSDFQAKYRSIIPSYISSDFISKDPSKTHKYLGWIGKVVSQEIGEGTFTGGDAEELMSMLGLFHRKVRGVDIFSFPNVSSFLEYMEKVSGQKSKRKEIEDQADLIFLNDIVRVVAPRTHEASRHFGGGTKWCISTSSGGHWENHFEENGDTVVFVINRQTKEKVAIVGNGISYATWYDQSDQTMGRDEKSEWISLLQKQENDEYGNAWYLVDDYFDSDEGNGNERRREFEEKKLQEEFEDYGKTSIDNNLKKHFEKKLELDDYIEEDVWNAMKLKAFENQEGYDRFLARVWWGTAGYHGNESAGDFDDIDDLNKMTDKEHEYELGELEDLLLYHYKLSEELDKVVQNAMEVDAYSMFFEKWRTDYIKAMTEVIAAMEAKLNDPKQMKFAFGGKLKATPRTFDELVRLISRLGYSEMADDMLRFSSGEVYNKQR